MTRLTASQEPRVKLNPQLTKDGSTVMCRIYLRYLADWIKRTEP